MGPEPWELAVAATGAAAAALHSSAQQQQEQHLHSSISIRSMIFAAALPAEVSGGPSAFLHTRGISAHQYFDWMVQLNCRICCQSFLPKLAICHLPATVRSSGTEIASFGERRSGSAAKGLTLVLFVLRQLLQPSCNDARTKRALAM
jgi:hypothetical protein